MTPTHRRLFASLPRYLLAWLWLQALQLHCQNIVTRHLPPLPPPIRFALLHALLSFLVLLLLPTRPLSIPTALGLAALLLTYQAQITRLTQRGTP